MQYNFDIDHIAAVKNVVANHLSLLVETILTNSIVLSALSNNFTLPDDAYIKTLKVHNSLASHAGLENI